MLKHKKIKQDVQLKVICTSLAAWAMAFTTLFIGGTEYLGREPMAVVNVVNPVYAMVTNQPNQLWSRNDNENETVHMPTKFDIGLQVPAIAGHR
jgi:hypothetical protein